MTDNSALSHPAIAQYGSPMPKKSADYARRCAGLVVTLLAGCQAFQALPLGSGSRSLGAKELAIATSEIHHPLLRPVRVDARDGLSPDEAAVAAVVLNPMLRAARDQAGEARAQLLIAGILPNPQLSANMDFLAGGTTAGAQTGTGYGLSWDLRSLLTHGREVQAARADTQAVALDIAWLEWETALAAQSALYDLAARREQVAKAEEISDRLFGQAALMKKAVADRQITMLDSAAIEASANDARATLLGLRQEAEQSRLALNRAIGYPPSANLRLQAGVSLPSRVNVPSSATLLSGLENRRLDLLALRRGYDSQDAKLRAAILGQFPKINIGLNRAVDTGNVGTFGPSLAIELPIFDRNQGKIALESATRQRLQDEYHARLFEARADIAAALADIRGLNARISQADAALPALRRLVDVSQRAVTAGNAEVSGLYTAQNDLTRKSVEIIQLRQELAKARIALEAAAAWHIFP
jgi:cobalt-zinc-cadmium efflux system outer membrane protein